MRKILLLILTLIAIINAQGQYDDQMKAQRRSFFEAMPINTDDIVFIGNSITNGGEWQEFFPEFSIKDRGISGDKTTDVLNRLHSIVIGHPQKVFIKIGTNDGPSLTNNQAIANRIGQIIDTFKIKSPTTEVYIETVLPRGNNNSIQDLNEKIKMICDAKNTPLLNIYSEVKNADSTNLNPNYTNDNLHLLGTGYSKWTQFLKPIIGATELGIEAKESVIQLPGLNHGYCNQRATEFELLHGRETDVLFIGDDVIDCVEWSEMFRNKNVKGRGIGVSVGTSVWMNQLSTILQEKIFKPYKNASPAKVFFYAGANDIIKNGKDASFVKTHLKTMIDFIRQQSPSTQIFIQGYLPHSNEDESNKLILANTELNNLANSYEKGVTFIDLFAAFKKSTTNTINGKYTISANALNAKGFLHWANTVYSYIDPSIKPVEEPADLTTTMPENGPKVSDDNQSYWYYIKGQRGNGGENYITANLDNTLSQKPYSQSAYQHWRIQYYEGGFVLQNRMTDKYINSAGKGELSLVTPIPDKTVQFRPSQDGIIPSNDRENYFYIENIGASQTSAAFRLHAGGGGNSFNLMNWTGNANDNSSWKFITANEDDDKTPEDEKNPLPQALVSIHNITLDGTTPYRLPDEEFNKIKDLEDGTIVITLRTDNSNPVGNQFIFSAADTTASFNYAGVALQGTTARIQMAPINSAEGWYSATGTPSYASDLRIIYKGEKSTNSLSLNINQTSSKTIELGTGTNPSYRFIKNFHTESSTNAFYLGGIVTSNNKNKYPLKGVVKNLTIYPTPLNSSQINYLHNNWSTLTSSISSTISPTNLIVFQNRDMLKVSLSKEQTITNAEIYNIHGQTISKLQNENGNCLEISTLGYPKGIYLIRLKSDGGKIFSRKIIIR